MQPFGGHAVRIPVLAEAICCVSLRQVTSCTRRRSNELSTRTVAWTTVARRRRIHDLRHTAAAALTGVCHMATTSSGCALAAATAEESTRCGAPGQPTENASTSIVASAWTASSGNVVRVGTRLLGSHKPRPYPHPCRPGGQCSGHRPSAADATGCQHRDGDHIQHICQQR
jgi:hypothetical protein